MWWDFGKIQNVATMTDTKWVHQARAISNYLSLAGMRAPTLFIQILREKNTRIFLEEQLSLGNAVVLRGITLSLALPFSENKIRVKHLLCRDDIRLPTRRRERAMWSFGRWSFHTVSVLHLVFPMPHHMTSRNQSLRLNNNLRLRHQPKMAKNAQFRTVT